MKHCSLMTFLGLLLCVFAPATTRADDQKITFATDWKAQAEHGGFYQALALGFYNEAGLDVTLRPGGPQLDNPRLLAAGALDIAMASNSFQPFILQAAGVEVRVLMAAFQKDPQILMVHENVEAKSFHDLKGMPIFIADSAISTFWPWLKARFAFEDRQIRKYTYSIAPWLVNKNTVLEGYLSSEPYTAQQQGANPKVLLFADQGYPGYAAMIMARKDFIDANPAEISAFVKASIKGWQSYMFDDPTPANTLILKDNPEMTADLLAYARSTMLANDIVGTREQIGMMDPSRWSAFYDEMASLGALQQGLNPQDAYSLDYVPKPQ